MSRLRTRFGYRESEPIVHWERWRDPFPLVCFSLGLGLLIGHFS